MHDLIRSDQNITESRQHIESESGRLKKIKLVRPRLFETGNFERCRDRDPSRPINLKGVETETIRDSQITGHRDAILSDC